MHRQTKKQTNHISMLFEGQPEENTDTTIQFNGRNETVTM